MCYSEYIVNACNGWVAKFCFYAFCNLIFKGLQEDIQETSCVASPNQCTSGIHHCKNCTKVGQPLACWGYRTSVDHLGDCRHNTLGLVVNRQLIFTIFHFFFMVVKLPVFTVSHVFIMCTRSLT